MLLRRHLDQRLRVQLSFFVKVKFDLKKTPLWRPAPTTPADAVALSPDPDQRMTEIVEGAGLKLDERLESAGSATRASSLVASSYLLVGPGTAMNMLPPPAKRGRGASLPSAARELARKKCQSGTLALRSIPCQVAQAARQAPRAFEPAHRRGLLRAQLHPAVRAPLQKQKRELRAFSYDWSTLPDPAERGVTCRQDPHLCVGLV